MGRIGLIFVILLSLVNVYGDDFYTEEDILDVPYMAAIYAKVDTEDYAFLCNGVIIDPIHILTTATCLAGTRTYDVMVRIGSAHADRGGTKNYNTIYTSHPQFDPDFNYDIALIKVYNSMVLSSRVAIVKLPEEDSLLDGVVTGKYITWNILTETQKVVQFSLRTLSNTTCSTSYQASYPSKELFTDKMLCTEESRYFCEQRSGGPFIVDDTLYGLYSWTYKCDKPGVFTRVSAFISWIDSIRNEDSDTIAMSEREIA